MNINPKPLPPFKWYISQNFPFIEADYDAVTEWQLLQQVGTQCKALTDVVNYLENYFKDLDLQEEVNNKLDEMAESGELEEIIAQYLQLSGLNTFDTVSDMKLAENVIAGQTVQTLGYHSKNDGGKAIYKIREVTNADTVDEMLLIALTDQSLVAELCEDTSINVKQLGAYGDNSHDDLIPIQKAISSFNDIYLPNGSYKITDTLNISQAKKITGETGQRTSLRYYGTGTAIEIKYTAWGTLQIENLFIVKENDPSGYDESDTTSIGINIVENSDNNRIVTNLSMKNVIVRYFYKQLNIADSGALLNSLIENCLFQYGYYGAYLTGGFNNKFIACTFSNATVGMRQRAGECNFYGCKFETNDTGARLENPLSLANFTDCFFENQTQTEGIYLLRTAYNEGLDDIHLINLKGCHFYGGYNQIYLRHTKKLSCIGCRIVNAGNATINFVDGDTNAEVWNFMSNNIDVIPEGFNSQTFVQNFDNLA